MLEFISFDEASICDFDVYWYMRNFSIMIFVSFSEVLKIKDALKYVCIIGRVLLIIYYGTLSSKEKYICIIRFL